MFDLKSSNKVGLFKLTMVAAHLTDLEKIVIEMAWEDRTTFEAILCNLA
jgi:hypothetical protein